MAKVATRDLFVRRSDGSIPAEGGRAKLRRRTGWKTLASSVKVIRTGASGAKAFEACVVVGGGPPFTMELQQRMWRRASKTRSGYTTSCMFGQNPRAALASALARASRQMKKRGGAFARYR